MKEKHLKRLLKKINRYNKWAKRWDYQEISFVDNEIKGCVDIKYDDNRPFWRWKTFKEIYTDGEMLRDFQKINDYFEKHKNKWSH